MRISFVGHACLLVEAGGVTVLSDPWWRGPCFGAQWWNYPAPSLTVLKDKRIDYVYISHGHHDHFHPGTLSTLSRDAKVIVSRATGLAPFVKTLGFDVIELGDDDVCELGSRGVTCRVMKTHGEDTLMAITDGHEVCINLNDALHSAPRETQDRFVARLKALFPDIDYVFCGYGVASHFPNCYIIPDKNRELTAANRQRYFNRQWARLIASLDPKFGFPFAADVIFLEDDLFWVNEPTHNSERPTDVFRELNPRSGVSVLDIAPGVVIEDGEVVEPAARTPVNAEEIRASCADQFARANHHGRVTETAVKDACALLQSALDRCANYLASYDEDYRFLVRLRNGSSGIAIEKKGRKLSVATVPAQSSSPDAGAYDIVYTTRLAYLKRSLTELHGNEILFVGSGGLLQYRERPKSGQNLNQELIYLLKKRDVASASRYGTSRLYVVKAKRALKRLLTREQPDLYDVARWTVFAGDNG